MAKFIEVTRTDKCDLFKNKKAYLNIEHIVSVHENVDGICIISTTELSSYGDINDLASYDYEVTESYETIKEKLYKATHPESEG